MTDHIVVESVPSHRLDRLCLALDLDRAIVQAVRSGVIGPMRLRAHGVVVDVYRHDVVLAGPMRQVDTVLSAIGIDTVDCSA